MPSRPLRELRAFGRIDLGAGAEGELTFTLGERAFSQWDGEARRFAPIPGRHEIAVGSAPRDLRPRESVTFAAEPAAHLRLPPGAAARGRRTKGQA